MFASLLRPKGKSARRHDNPYPSPTTAADSTPSPIVARRIRVHEPQARPLRRAKTDIEDEELYHNNHGDSDEQEEAEDVTPLLPIFSAPHLGMHIVRSFVRDLY